MLDVYFLCFLCITVVILVRQHLIERRLKICEEKINEESITALKYVNYLRDKLERLACSYKCLATHHQWCQDDQQDDIDELKNAIETLKIHNVCTTDIDMLLTQSDLIAEYLRTSIDNQKAYERSLKALSSRQNKHEARVLMFIDSLNGLYGRMMLRENSNILMDLPMQTQPVHAEPDAPTLEEILGNSEIEGPTLVVSDDFEMSINGLIDGLAAGWAAAGRSDLLDPD